MASGELWVRLGEFAYGTMVSGEKEGREEGMMDNRKSPPPDDVHQTLPLVRYRYF